MVRVRWCQRSRRILLVVTLGALIICGGLQGVISGAGTGTGDFLAPPPELAAASEPEGFSEETLFDITNGDADLYLEAGSVQLDTWLPPEGGSASMA